MKNEKYAVTDAAGTHVITYPDDHCGSPPDKMIFDSLEKAYSEWQNSKRWHKERTALVRMVTLFEIIES